MHMRRNMFTLQIVLFQVELHDDGLRLADHLLTELLSVEAFLASQLFLAVANIALQRNNLD